MCSLNKLSSSDSYMTPHRTRRKSLLLNKKMNCFKKNAFGFQVSKRPRNGSVLIKGLNPRIRSKAIGNTSNGR
jgi:hypothetical protein